MSLPYDYTRCNGDECPLKEDCERYTDKAKGAHPRQISVFVTSPYNEDTKSCDSQITPNNWNK